MNLLRDGPDAAAASIVLAHGAGAPMDSRFMNDFAKALAARALQVIRFEFAYMASRREGEGRKPPPRAESLKREYLTLVAGLAEGRPLFIGGKSMGSRVASMVADELFRAKKIAGLACLGYPFHPPGQPAKLRTAHLEALSTPTLICQGTRDPFGTREEVEAYPLSSAIDVHWLEDGDHDFKPRRESGLTAKQNLNTAADVVAGWVVATLQS